MSHFYFNECQDMYIVYGQHMCLRNIQLNQNQLYYSVQKRHCLFPKREIVLLCFIGNVIGIRLVPFGRKFLYQKSFQSTKLLSLLPMITIIKMKIYFIFIIYNNTQHLTNTSSISSHSTHRPHK